MRKALFAGSFDPVTLGHVDIVARAAALFDEIFVAIGENSTKKYFFSLEERLEMLELAFAGLDNVHVQAYKGLTVDFARNNGVKFLLRGLRSGADLEYERPIALINQYMEPDLETVYLVSSSESAHISSTLVREVIRYGRDASGLIPLASMPVVHRHAAKG
ncbi:MAG TPA: pantetheine-phosphate adenylyltransferase [Bacteroidetes bacterium]|nr:pantetheine-phosphate adenylyltransferase [Bacteroidota bacterium]